MSRYSDDPYLHPATGVLKNRLGITDQATLEKTEADLVAARSYELSNEPLKAKAELSRFLTGSQEKNTWRGWSGNSSANAPGIISES
jgi:hypothetical protein